MFAGLFWKYLKNTQWLKCLRRDFEVWVVEILVQSPLFRRDPLHSRFLRNPVCNLEPATGFGFDASILSFTKSAIGKGNKKEFLNTKKHTINHLITRNYLRFWYHVFTWVSDKLRTSATSDLSATLRYFCIRNLLSKKANWEWVKAASNKLCWNASTTLLSHYCMITGGNMKHSRNVHNN